MAFVLSGVVEGLLQVGGALGMDRAPLLASAELDDAVLFDRDRTLPLRAQIAVGRAIVAARPSVNLALEMLRRMQPGALGALGYALASSESLAQALSVFVRHQGYLTDALRWARPDPVTIVVDAHPELEALGHPVESAVGLWVALGRRLACQPWAPRQVSFRHQPAGDPEEHAAFFGVAPRFGADRNALVLDPATLALPVRVDPIRVHPVRVDPGRVDPARVDLRRVDPVRVDRDSVQPISRGLDRDGQEPDVVTMVRVELRRRLPQGAAQKESVARALGMSVRTLARRLEEAGTRYGEVLDETRRRMALELLGETTLAVYEVSFLLGYSEPSTFHRTFRRWTGASPRAWRAAREQV